MKFLEYIIEKLLIKQKNGIETISNSFGKMHIKASDGNPHCTHGPAIEYSNGTKQWYINGLLHRSDGAAIEWDNGHYEWISNGKYIFWRNK